MSRFMFWQGIQTKNFSRASRENGSLKMFESFGMSRFMFSPARRLVCNTSPTNMCKPSSSILWVGVRHSEV